MPSHVLIVYTGPSEAVDVDGVTLERGVPAEVPEALAAALLAQGTFTTPKPARAKPERAVKPPAETRGQTISEIKE